MWPLTRSFAETNQIRIRIRIARYNWEESSNIPFTLPHGQNEKPRFQLLVSASLFLSVSKEKVPGPARLSFCFGLFRGSLENGQRVPNLREGVGVPWFTKIIYVNNSQGNNSCNCNCNLDYVCNCNWCFVHWETEAHVKMSFLDKLFM